MAELQEVIYVILCKSVILVILYIQGGDGTNITASIGSSSSSSSKNETSENFDKMEKGTQNSDCGQEPVDVDINKEKKSKMNPVPATEQVCTYSMSH